MTHFRTATGMYVGPYVGGRRVLVESRSDAVAFHEDQKKCIERLIGERVEAVGLKETRDGNH